MSLSVVNCSSYRSVKCIFIGPVAELSEKTYSGGSIKSISINMNRKKCYQPKSSQFNVVDFTFVYIIKGNGELAFLEGR